MFYIKLKGKICIVINLLYKKDYKLVFKKYRIVFSNDLKNDEHMFSCTVNNGTTFRLW